MDIIKSRKTTAYIFACMGLFVSLLLSCSDKDANTAEERALAFAQNYFNLRYKQSLTLCTENAKKWIVFRATNITQEDVDVINAQTDTAECEIDDVELNDDETTADVKMTIKNVLVCDSIGKRGSIKEKIKKTLRMRKVSDNWYVDTECPI